MDNLETIWKWIKKHWYIPSALLFIFLIILPVILKTFFKINISDNWLGFYWSTLTSIGIAFWGKVELLQKSAIHKKIMSIQEKKDRERIMSAKPYLQGLNGKFSDGLMLITVSIVNVSNYMAYDLKIHNTEISGSEEIVFYANIGITNVPAGGTLDVIFLRSNPLLCTFNGNEEFIFVIDYKDEENDGTVYSTKLRYLSNVPDLFFMQNSNGVPL